VGVAVVVVVGGGLVGVLAVGGVARAVVRVARPGFGLAPGTAPGRRGLLGG